MSLKDWQSSGTAQAWSSAVGPYGDIFQRTLTVPYFLAVLSYFKTLAGKTTFKHPPDNQPTITELFYSNLQEHWTAVDPAQTGRAINSFLSKTLRSYNLRDVRL